MDKAKKRLNSASLLLCVFDASSELTDEDLEIIDMVGDIPSIAVINKCDLTKQPDDSKIKEAFGEVIYMSAKNGDGADKLIEAVKRICAVGNINSADALIYNERQRSLTKKTMDSVDEAIEALHIGMTFDAVTVSIEEAVAYLCELTGERVTDEVVDKVFHTFCVGK